MHAAAIRWWSGRNRSPAQSGDTGEAEGAQRNGRLGTGRREELVAAKGGAIDLRANAGTSVRVVFPQDALAKNQTLVISPLTQAPASSDDVIEKGFRLETKGADAGPALRYPAFVTFAVAKKVATDTAIVRYLGDGTYEVLPTKVYRVRSRAS